MKIEKFKTIMIVVLSVLLIMSIFTQVLFYTLLGINSVAALKKVMLANEPLPSLGESSSCESTNKHSESFPSSTVPTEPSTDSAKPSVDDTMVLLNSNEVKITYIGVEYDTFWDCYKLKFSIENSSNTDITISSAEEVIDGYMVDTSIGFYCEVIAGKKAVDYMILYNFDLEQLGITEPNTIEFKMNVTASDDLFNDIAKSDTVTIYIE